VTALQSPVTDHQWRQWIARIARDVGEPIGGPKTVRAVETLFERAGDPPPSAPHAAQMVFEIARTAKSGRTDQAVQNLQSFLHPG